MFRVGFKAFFGWACGELCHSTYIDNVVVLVSVVEEEK